MARKQRKMLWGNEVLSYKEISIELNISYEAFYNMIRVRKFTTKDQVIAHRKKVDNKRKKYRKPGGHAPKSHRTSEGKFTFKQMADHHGGLSHQAMRARASVWGVNHKGIWLEVMSKPEFYRQAIELDGPPRGRKSVSKFVRDTVTEVKVLPVNRTEACFRDKGQLRCSRYRARWLSEDPNPIECKAGNGNKCPNYTGKRIKVGNRDAHGG